MVAEEIFSTVHVIPSSDTMPLKGLFIIWFFFQARLTEKFPIKNTNAPVPIIGHI